MTNSQPQPGASLNRAPRRGRGGLSAGVGMAIGIAAAELARGPWSVARLTEDATLAAVGADLVMDCKNINEGGANNRDPKALRRALISLADVGAVLLTAGLDAVQIVNGQMPMSAVLGMNANHRLMQTRAMLTQIVDAGVDIADEIKENGTTGLSKVAVGAFPVLLGTLAGVGLGVADNMLLGGSTTEAVLYGATGGACITNAITTGISRSEGGAIAGADIFTSLAIAGAETAGAMFSDQPLVQAGVPLVESSLMAANKFMHRANA